MLSRCISGGRSATLRPIRPSARLAALAAASRAIEVGQVLLSLRRFLKRLIGADLAVVAGAGEQIAQAGADILPADLAVVFGGDGEQHGQHAEVPAAILVARRL